jgi:CO/xanthine dehydrogenase Mo-binding subunit
VPRIEIAAKRAQTGGPIVAAAAVNPSAAAPGFATQFCDVEVDPDTGNPT